MDALRNSIRTTGSSLSIPIQRSSRLCHPSQPWRLSSSGAETSPHSRESRIPRTSVCRPSSNARSSPSLRPAEVQRVEIEEAAQVLDRAVGVVDAQIEPPVVISAVAATGPDHEQRGGLHTPLLPTRLLTGGEGREEPVRQPSGRTAEGDGHRLGDFGVGEDVALSGEAIPGDADGVFEAVLPGVRGAAIRRQRPSRPADDYASRRPAVSRSIVSSGESPDSSNSSPRFP